MVAAFDVPALMGDGTTLGRTRVSPLSVAVDGRRSCCARPMARDSPSVGAWIDPVIAARLVVLQDASSRMASGSVRFEHERGYDSVESAGRIPGSTDAWECSESVTAGTPSYSQLLSARRVWRLSRRRSPGPTS